MTAQSAAAGIQVHAQTGARQAEILSARGARLPRRPASPLRRAPARAARAPRRAAEAVRRRRSCRDFLAETKAIRDGDWKVAPIPADLLDRRVEITGPVDRKMIVNALNSGAKVFMADFEDASSPVFANMIEGQANLRDRWAGTIDFTDPASGKAYALKAKPAALMVRPRGWHLPERHVLVDGAGDVGLAVRLRPLRLPLRQGADGDGLDARLLSAEDRKPSRGAAVERRLLAMPRRRSAFAHGTFKATVLIETLPAAFEMDEILYELRDHIVGLNCGRWDYIFSFIKRLGKNPAFLTPDRSAMTMGKAFLAAYSLLLIKTCHRRGAFAMGGMAAQIPIKGDPARQRRRLRQGARRQGARGRQRPRRHLGRPSRPRAGRDGGVRPADAGRRTSSAVCATTSTSTAADLLEVHEGERTEDGLAREHPRRRAIYRGVAARPRRRAALQSDGGRRDRRNLARPGVAMAAPEGEARRRPRRDAGPVPRRRSPTRWSKVRAAVGEKAYDGGRFAEAIRLFADMSLSPTFEEFLTLPAYRLID